MKVYLTFLVGSECYCINMANVVEILSTNRIVSIHQQAKYVKGFISFNDKMVPIIDLRTRFLKEICDYNEKTCIIIAKKEKIMVGLIVDKTDEVLPISQSLLNHAAITCGPTITLTMGDRIIKLLNCSMLLSEKEWMEMELLIEHSKYFNLEENY